MSTQDQLELISASGEIEFYSLDPGQGITNIGRHPDNDIILDSPGVAPFHAMLDHRQKPYHLLVLSQEAETIVSGELLPANIFQPLQAWDHIQLGDYTLILVEGSGAGVSPGLAAMPAAPSAPTPARPTGFAPPPTRPEPPPTPYWTGPPPVGPAAIPAPVAPPVSPAIPPAAVVGLGARPLDHEDDIIRVELSAREWTIDVEQSASFQVTLLNGGDIVATFAVGIEGLPEQWVTISPPYVNLNERERATVTITLSVPRHPSSRAGVHHFAVVVTSATYRDRYSQRGATLTINPYYDFSVGELSPKHQTISWFRHTGQVTVPINNKGNSSALFRLEGIDNERACSFEFRVPGEEVGLAQQAELTLPSEEIITVPVQITPRSRRLIGFGKRTYAFTITSTPLAGQQTPRSQLGELKSAPLIGPLILALIMLLLMVIIVIIVSPRLRTFMMAGGGTTAMISNGTPVAIQWETSFFTTERSIQPNIEGLPQPLPRRGTVVAYPVTDTTYTLSGGNLLSGLAPVLFAPPTKAIQVDVNPRAPAITFDVQPAQLIGDGEVLLTWQVQNADKIELFRRVGDTNALEAIGDFSEQPNGSLLVTPEPNQGSTTYVLLASNTYAPTATPVPKIVTVLTPTPTLVPTPIVRRFDVRPQTIVAGESVVVEWAVEGADLVRVSDVEQPAEGTFSQSPQQNTQYTMYASAANDTARIPIRSIQVVVMTPTPTPSATPEPRAPVIDFFTASEDEIIKGDDDTVDLTWSVSGQTTDIQITGSFGTITNQAAQGLFAAPIDETTVFVLTAFNGDVKTSASAKVDVLEPTPTQPPPTQPPPTPGPPNIVFFNLSPANSEDEDKVEFQGGTEYEVEIGTRVLLKWSVQNASQVELLRNDESLGNQPFESTGFAQDIREPATYQLKATNEGNPESQSAFIQVTAKTPSIPAPFNVDADVATDTITIEWDYNNEAENDIESFRVYRADVTADANDFDRIAEIPKDQPKEFEDDGIDNRPCGWAYYVVAVYIDFNTGNLLETPASANSWYSPPCS